MPEMVEVKVPTVGESIQEVQIGQWLKREGEWIAKDDNLVDLETEKASVQVPAPVSGIIRKLHKKPEEFAGIGETIADIVPTDPRLVIEAHIRTDDISRVVQGQPADIRLTAYSHRSTRLVSGRVFYVGADRSVDRATQQTYYVALIEADPASLAAAGANVKLQAGMPAEVFIKGDERTALQYLLEPVTEVLRRAGRER